MRTSRTFWDLLGEEAIEIPLIQRDYAQGRSDRKTRQIREEFVNTLCTFVEDQNRRLDLDFVYGSSSSGKLVLLDGQQRLTTLFLLHWYVALQSGMSSVDVKDRLKRFSYETRTSSRDFCEALIASTFEKGSVEAADVLSGIIEDSPWFAMAWKKDPTVASMLIMLDEIHRVFKTKVNVSLWEKLTDTQKPAITFYFLDMDMFKLTDELYIKMNSRGKSLSDFENFKAWLEKYSTENRFALDSGWEEKIDKRWTDLFWMHREKESYDVDEPFLAFFKGMGLCRFAQSLPMAASKLENKADDAWIKTFNAEKFVATNDYEALGCFDENTLKQIFLLLDFFTDYLSQSEKRDTDLDELFAMFITPKYVERVVSYAFAVFISQAPAFEKWNESIYKNARQWVRVMRNLIQNARIDDPDAFTLGIQSIDDLAKRILPGVFSGDMTVYDAFAQIEKLEISPFRGVQVEEEIRKCKLLSENGAWEEQMRIYEDHPYFYGQIGFLLDYGANDLEKFMQYAQKAAKLFEPVLLSSKKHLVERALLAVEDYLIEVGNHNNGFCLSSTGTSRLRDENWRSVFNDPERSQYLKKLLDRVAVDRLEDSLDEVIDVALRSENLEEWRRLIIECPAVIEACGSRQIRWDNEGRNVYLLSKSRMSGYYKELRSYYFYKTFLEAKRKTDWKEPFKNVDYFSAVGNDEIPCAYLDGWHYESVNVALDISFDGEYYILDVFGRDEKEVPHKLLELLEEYGFDCSETEWPRRRVDKASLISVIEILIEKFKVLDEEKAKL